MPIEPSNPRLQRTALGAAELRLPSVLLPPHIDLSVTETPRHSMSIVGIRHSHRRVKAVSIMPEDVTAGLWQSEKDDAFLVRSLRHPKTILTLLGKGLTSMIERSF